MSEFKPTQVQGSINKMTVKSGGSVKIEFETQQNVTGDVIKYFSEQIDKYGWITHSARIIEAEEIISLPPLVKEKGKKSPSTRLREVFYRLWQQNNEKFEKSDDYYVDKMEKLIDHYKEMLD